VEAALDFELENLIPYNLEDIATTWTVSERRPGMTQLLTAVTPREPLVERIRHASAANSEPRSAVVPAAVLGELVPDAVADPTAVLSIGESQSHLAVMHRGLRFARTIRAGGADIDQALARQFGLSPEKAKEAKESEARLLGAEGAYAPEDARRVHDAVAAGLTPLLRAVAATFKAMPAEHQPSRLLLTGGSSRLLGLAEYLAMRLGIDVELVDLRASLGEIGCVPRKLGPEFAVPVAMVLAGLRHGRATPLNFRRGELAYHGDIQVYRGEITRIGIGLAVVLLLAIATSVVRYTLISAEESQIDSAICQATKKIVGREICDGTAAIAAMRSPPSVGEGMEVPSYSASALLDMLSKLIGEDIDVAFDDVEMRVTGRVDDPDRINAKGEAASFEMAEEVSTRLKQHPCVREAEVSNQKKTRTGRVEFRLATKVICPVGVLPSAAVKVAEAPSPPEPSDEVER
jgi:cell division ATPase FtsA